MNRLCIFAIIAPVLVFGVLPLGWAQDAKKPMAEADLKMLVQGNNEFAFDLYSRLSKEKGNIVFSPYSISTALAMTYGGARGETAKQMAKVLRFTLPQERLHPAFGALVADLQKDDDNRPYQLRVANSLWGQQGHPFKAEFLRLTQKNYDGGLKEIDFQRHAVESRRTINRWVEDKTRGVIKELLLEPDVTSNTRLVLTNAIYFKATWTIPFEKDQTKDTTFEVGPTEKAQVPMMHREGQFRYFAGNDIQWLELPYNGQRQSMILLLPQKRGGIAEMEKRLTPTGIRQGIESLELRPGSVGLPRFKATCRFNLGSTLAEMGMPLAFRSNADFSGIGDGLSISKVIHEGFIDVDELGTEATAATAVAVNQSGLSGPRFSFRADHPFLFLIRDTQTGSILFQGRVTNPRRHPA